MDATDITVVAGEPFARKITVTGAASVWPTLDTLEARSHVRSGRSEAYPLLYDLTPHLEVTIVGGDVVVDLQLNGSETRALAATLRAEAHYDMFVSDVGPTDERAVKIQFGRVTIESNVTAGTDA